MRESHSQQVRVARLVWSIHEAGRLDLAQTAAAEAMPARQINWYIARVADVLPIAPIAGGWQRIPDGVVGRPVTPIQRAAVLAWLLASGDRLSVRQAAERVGLARNSAYVILANLSQVLPIYDDWEVWTRC